jgi:hypothetical protein
MAHSHVVLYSLGAGFIPCLPEYPLQLLALRLEHQLPFEERREQFQVCAVHCLDLESVLEYVYILWGYYR